jgi:hypothetical protein
MAITESKEKREGKEKKIGIKPYLTTIHTPLKKKEDVKSITITIIVISRARHINMTERLTR